MIAESLRDVRVVADHQERPCGHGAGHVSPRVRRGLLRVLLAAVHQRHHAVRRLREGLKGKLNLFSVMSQFWLGWSLMVVPILLLLNGSL